MKSMSAQTGTSLLHLPYIFAYLMVFLLSLVDLGEAHCFTLLFALCLFLSLLFDKRQKVGLLFLFPSKYVALF